MGMSIRNCSMAFLQQMLGTSSPIQPISVSSLSSPETKAKLKAAGINVNSGQYKAVVSSMMSVPNAGMGYTNIQAIKNRMSHYDQDGDYISPVTGLAGLLITDKNRASKDRIIPISESSREEMFQLVKREFIRDSGVHSGNTGRTDVYIHMYRQTPKNDRLAAGHTLGQYERQYWLSLVDAVRAKNPGWQPGDYFDAGLLKDITRESVEGTLTQSGSSLIRKPFQAKA